VRLLSTPNTTLQISLISKLIWGGRDLEEEPFARGAAPGQFLVNHDEPIAPTTIDLPPITSSRQIITPSSNILAEQPQSTLPALQPTLPALQPTLLALQPPLLAPQLHPIQSPTTQVTRIIEDGRHLEQGLVRAQHAAAGAECLGLTQSQEPGGDWAMNAMTWTPTLAGGSAVLPHISLADWDPAVTMAGHLAPPDTTLCDMVCARLGDGSWKCMLSSCFRCFSRYQDLARHQNSKHVRIRSFPCRSSGCLRAEDGFSRKYNRDAHEKKVHGGKLE